MVIAQNVARLSVSADVDRAYKPLFDRQTTPEGIVAVNRLIRLHCYNSVRTMFGDQKSPKTSQYLPFTPHIDGEMVEIMLATLRNNGGIATYNDAALDACVAFYQRRFGSSPLRFPEFLNDIGFYLVGLLYRELPE
jgi:hypothetical protein